MRAVIWTVTKTYSVYTECGLSNPNHSRSKEEAGPLFSSAIENSTLLITEETFIHTFVPITKLRSECNSVFLPFHYPPYHKVKSSASTLCKPWSDQNCTGESEEPALASDTVHRVYKGHETLRRTKLKKLPLPLKLRLGVTRELCGRRRPAGEQ